MKKISFSEKYGLHQAVLSGRKTMTRRISINTKPLYKVGEVVAIAERYRDIIEDTDPRRKELVKHAGWDNKMYVAAALMPHHVRITSVKEERLRDITPEDCKKEGVFHCKFPGKEIFFSAETPQSLFRILIECISGRGIWSENPSVWVYEFELID